MAHGNPLFEQQRYGHNEWPMPYANPERRMFLGGVTDFFKNNAGAIGTGLGAIGGSFVGAPQAGAAIGGAIGGRIQQAGQKRPQRQQRPVGRRMPVTVPETTTASTGNEGSFARGGSIDIGQDAMKFAGPSHSRGGIDLPGNIEVEGGETMDFVEMGRDKSGYIFSDRVTLPDSNKTFSEAHQELIESGASEEDVKELANLQEEVTGRAEGGRMPVASPKKAYGGYTKEKARGGYTDKEYQDGGFANPLLPSGAAGEMNADAMNTFFEDYSSPNTNLPTTGVDYSNQGAMRTPNVGNIPGYAGESSPSEVASNATSDGFFDNIDFSETASTVASFAPAAINIGRGLFGETAEPESSYVPISGRSTQTLRQQDTDINVDPQLAEARAGLRAITTNPNASTNEKLAAFTASTRQRNKILSREENKETQLENQKLSQIAQNQRQIESTNTGRLMQDQQRRAAIERKSEAAKQNLLSRGLAQATTAFERRQQREALQNRNATQIALTLSRMDPAVREGTIEDLREVLPEGKMREVLKRYEGS